MAELMDKLRDRIHEDFYPAFALKLAGRIDQRTRFGRIGILQFVSARMAAALQPG
jgi:hypothetical protein